MIVLIVDHDHANLALFSHMLKAIPNVTPITMAEPIAALAWCASNEPDLVLVDYIMPDLDGLKFLQGLRALPGREDIPVVMVIADIQAEVRDKALQLRANDFLTKPVNKTELRLRVSNLLALRVAQRQLANCAAWLADEVAKATSETVARERDAILRLSRAAEYRDPETGAHLLRLTQYSRLIAANLGMDEAEQDLLGDAAPMHDIGKVGIPDNILLKPGRLDDQEMEVMRTHASIGADILCGSASPLLQVAAAIALTHHEKFDGSGYPNGLKGEQIPLYGRIIAVADVFDALTSARPYKKAWELDRAVALIREGSGSHFDPMCVEAFFQDWDTVMAIHKKTETGTTHEPCNRFP